MYFLFDIIGLMVQTVNEDPVQGAHSATQQTECPAPNPATTQSKQRGAYRSFGNRNKIMLITAKK